MPPSPSLPPCRLTRRLRRPKIRKILDAVSSDGLALANAPPEIANNRECVRAAVRSHTDAFRYASARLRGDRGFALELACSGHGAILEFASEECRGDRDVVIAAVRSHGRALRFAAAPLRNGSDRSFVLRAVRANPDALGALSPALRADREIALEATIRFPVAFHTAAHNIQTNRGFLIEALILNGDVLEAAGRAEPRHLCDRDLVRFALYKDGSALRYAHPSLRVDPELELLAGQAQRRALNLIPVNRERKLKSVARWRSETSERKRFRRMIKVMSLMKLQAAARRWLGRIQLREWASVRIQAVWRGRNTRIRLSRSKKRRGARRSGEELDYREFM